MQASMLIPEIESAPSTEMIRLFQDAATTGRYFEKKVKLTRNDVRWLLKNNKINRPLRDNNVRKFERALAEDKFFPDSSIFGFVKVKRGSKLARHYKLQFAENEEFKTMWYDGQHRVNAFEKTGIIPPAMLFRFNVSEEEAEVTDTNEKRSPADQALMYHGIRDSKKIQSFLASYTKLRNKAKINFTGADIEHFYVNNQEAVDYLNKVLDNRDAPCEVFGGAFKKSLGVSTAIMKAAFFLSYQSFPEQTKEFIRYFVLEEGPRWTHSAPPALLKHRLTRGHTKNGARRITSTAITYYTLSALRAWIEGREICQLTKGGVGGLDKLIEFFDNGHLYEANS